MEQSLATILFDDEIPDCWKVSGVYGIRCLANGRVYIGSAKNIRTRLLKHRLQLRTKAHHSVKLQNAFNKYGELAFVLRLVEIVDAGWLDVEQDYIDGGDTFTNGFNCRPKANSTLGFPASAQRKRLARESNLRTWANQTLRQTMSNMFKGKLRGVQTQSSSEKRSASLRLAHASNPSWRETLNQASRSLDARQKKSHAIRASLENPIVLQKRRAQFAAANQQRIANAVGYDVNGVQATATVLGLSTPEEVFQYAKTLSAIGFSNRRIATLMGRSYESHGTIKSWIDRASVLSTN